MASVGKKPKKIGKLKQNGVRLEPHEKRTVDFLRKSGHNIELIPPSNTPKTKTPDLLMDGVAWEMKCPRGSSANTLEHMIKNATKQSDSIIIDLGDSRLEESKALKIIRRRSRETRAIRRVKVVTKEKDLLDIKP